MYTRNSYPKLDANRITTDEEWNDYVERYNAWKKEHAGNLLSMEAAMSEPNPPNAYYANTH